MTQTQFQWVVIAFMAIMLLILILRKPKETMYVPPVLPGGGDGGDKATVKDNNQEKVVSTQPPSTAVAEQHDIKAIARKGFISAWSKIKFFLQLRESLWSIPLFFFLYYESAVVNHYFFGGSVTMYDPSFIQPLFLAGCYVLGAMALWQWVLWFYFRTIHRYIWGKHRPTQGENGITLNYSKKDFKELSAWQKILISFLLFAVVFSGFLLVSLKLM